MNKESLSDIFYRLLVNRYEAWVSTHYIDPVDLGETTYEKALAEYKEDAGIFAHDFSDILAEIAFDYYGTRREKKEAVRELLEVNYHYWRECPNCGYAGNNYIHCVHDKVQSKCIRCGKELPTIDGECECEFCITETDIENYIKEKDE